MKPTPTLFHALAPMLVAISLAACGGNDDGSDPRSSHEVVEWNAYTSDLVAANQPIAFQVHTLAIVQIAVHDALNGIAPRYEPYRYAGSAPGASLAAAVATAAHDTLVARVPAAAPAIDARYQQKLQSISDGSAKEAGVATGRAAAAAILELRSQDDMQSALTKPYTAGPAAPGVYQPTAPGNLVIGAGLGEVRPFASSSGGQLRSPPPLPTTGSDYAAQYAEIRDFGSVRSTQRSEQQTQTARFWYDVATKEWHGAARQGLAQASADEWQAARTLALLGIAMFDGVIASFDTKFKANYWRPITAVHAGDDDGNAATQGDAAWQPLCETPPFPEHNSTHAVTGAAAAGVLARTLGDSHDFSIDSPSLPGVRRSYQRFSDAATEEGLSRIYCGIHFRHAMDTGLAQGDAAAGLAVDGLLRRLPG